MPRGTEAWDWLWPRLTDLADRATLVAVGLMLLYVGVRVLLHVWRWPVNRARRWQKDRERVPEKEPDPHAPLLNADRDALNFAPYAERLRLVISDARAPEQSLAISISGSWGSGKTSLWNMALDGSSRQLSDRVVLFEPWLFDEADLQVEFLWTLESHFTERGDHGLADRVRDYASSLLAQGPWIARALGWLIPVRATDNRSRRIDLRQRLKRLDRPVVVLMDDVDRLLPSHLLAVAQLIRAHANFPNLVFVVLFDRQVAIQHIAMSGFDGNAYLEKVVQTEIPVPKADAGRLETLWRPEFERIMDWQSWDQEARGRWQFACHYGVRSLLETPRDAQRFASSLAFSWPSVSRLVDPVDFALVAVLRLAEPRVHEELWARRRRLFGWEWSQIIDRGGVEATSEKETIVSVASPQHREAVEFILGLLLERQHGSSRRFLSESHFEAYFGFSPPQGLCSAEELDAYLALDEADLSVWISEPGMVRLEEFLQSLAWHAPPLEVPDRVKVIRVLLNVWDGGERSDEERENIRSLRSDLLRSVCDLTALDMSQRDFSEEVASVLLEAGGLGTFSVLSQVQQGAANTPEAREWIREHKPQILDRCRDVALSARLADYSSPARLLSVWVALADNASEFVEEARAAFRVLARDPRTVGKALRSALTVSVSNGGTTYEVPRSGTSLIEPSEFLELAEKFRAFLPEEVVEAVAAFDEEAHRQSLAVALSERAEADQVFIDEIHEPLSDNA